MKDLGLRLAESLEEAKITQEDADRSMKIANREFLRSLRNASKWGWKIREDEMIRDEQLARMVHYEFENMQKLPGGKRPFADVAFVFDPDGEIGKKGWGLTVADKNDTMDTLAKVAGLEMERENSETVVARVGENPKTAARKAVDQIRKWGMLEDPLDYEYWEYGEV